MLKIFNKLILGLIYSLSLLTLLYVFVVQPFPINGESMKPTINDGDILLTYKLGYRFGNPKRGDIVVFKSPEKNQCTNNDKCDFIKRVIGLPGDSVIVNSGKVYLNGILFEEPYAFKDQKGVKEVIVEDNKYYLMGDNRSVSFDSRDYGVVDKKDIIGNAVIRIWPINKIALLKK